MLDNFQDVQAVEASLLELAARHGNVGELNRDRTIEEIYKGNRVSIASFFTAIPFVFYEDPFADNPHAHCMTIGELAKNFSNSTGAEKINAA